MDTKTAATEAHVTIATIRSWARRGVIAATKKAGRWSIDAASLAHRIAIAALKAARRTPKQIVLTVENLIAIGGRRWQKNGMDRIYFNGWQDFAGVEVTHYKSGNISSASIGGRGIANGRAYNLAGAISKVYFDAADGRLHAQHYGAREYEIRYLNGDRDYLDLVQMTFDGIKSAVAAL
jgi:hypothetical protein